MEALQAYLQARGADLLAAREYAEAAVAARALPGPLPPTSVLATTAGALLLVQLAAVCLTRRGRRLVFGSVPVAAE